jgi:hypothetical protein
MQLPIKLWKTLKIFLLLRKILKQIFQKNQTTPELERGVFHYDEKQKKWVKKYDKPQEDGVYAMPLQEYQERKYHLTKGSWHRQPDPRHANKEALEHNDFGQAGCRSGHGFNHPMRDGRCIYCSNTQNQIEKIWKEDEKRRSV